MDADNAGGTTDAQIASIRAELQELREEGKAREPNILAAMRTLIEDSLKWKQGERDFPKAALIGAAFAYLRPRVVIFLGSVAAIVFAAIQVTILYQQNALISQQNTLIQDQGYALRAQTAAVLLDGLESNAGSKSYFTTLAAFGDIGIDALVQIASGFSQAGDTARSVLLDISDQLSPEQAVRALSTLIEYDTGAIANAWRDKKEADSRVEEVALREGRPVPVLPRTVRKTAFTNVAEVLMADSATRGRLSIPPTLQSLEFIRVRPVDLTKLPKQVRTLTFWTVDDLFRRMSAAYGLDNPDPFVGADELAELMCYPKGTTSPQTFGSKLVNIANSLTTPESTALDDIVGNEFMAWCPNAREGGG